MAAMSKRHRRPNRVGTAVVAIAMLVCGTTAQAQRRGRPEELRGSKASVQRMHDFAQAHRLPFYLTQTNVDTAVARGRLVPLTGDSTYELTKGVGFSYATREAREFIQSFAPQYAAACGAPLIVTSAARPLNRQPRNSNPYSVHPTGIAVDLRRPPAGPCQTWVRSALAVLERAGIIEATEERHPVHFHIAVLVPPGRTVSLPRLGGADLAAARSRAPAATVSNSKSIASEAGKGGRAYIVRQGDTLWDIANRSGLTVEAIKRANGGMIKKSLRPGTKLILPDQGAL
jgi:hypothetical protein